MMYPYITFNDKTEITHSQLYPNQTVRIYIEKPDKIDGFHYTECYLPGYVWGENVGFSSEEMERFNEFIKNNAHLIIEYAEKGGITNVLNSNTDNKS